MSINKYRNRGNEDRRAVAGDFQTMKAELVRAKELYKDPDFPAHNRSLGVKLSLKLKYEVVWRRPKEIVQEQNIQKKAVFMEEGATRHDVDQGVLGDCWFLAAAAVLASTEKVLFEKVVPPDQEFDTNYAGMFRFNFWWYGKWTEVVVDDYLPTDGKRLIFCRNRDQPNEFWSALLEKAYAKLHGSYSALVGGLFCDAMVDLTGGISETIDLKRDGKKRSNIYDLLKASHGMKSMMGASINAPEGTNQTGKKLPNGLILGHAYSITGFQQLRREDGTNINLLRIRNPWGQGEWNGAWSDGSSEMKSLHPEYKGKLECANPLDGEFWMEYQDLLQNFDRIELCHLQVNALFDQIGNNSNKQDWNFKVFNGEWDRGSTAGGCGNEPNEEKYWRNPQFFINLRKPDTIHSHSGDCTVIISLMEKEYRNTLGPKENVAIGFALYKLKNSDHGPLNGKKAPKDALLLIGKSGIYKPDREVTKRFTVEPGDYVVIPSTFYPNQEAKFMLRIFTEQFAEKFEESDVMEIKSMPTPSVRSTKDFMQELFDKHSGPDRLLDAWELQMFLQDVSEEDITQKLVFDIEQCRSMLPMANISETGRLKFNEAKQLWKNIKFYRKVFLQFDKDKTNSVDTFELIDVLTKLEIPVSRSVLTAMVRRYGDRENKISFQDFIVAVMRLIQLFYVYKEYEGKSDKAGTAQFTQNEFLQHTMYL